MVRRKKHVGGIGKPQITVEPYPKPLSRIVRVPIKHIPFVEMPTGAYMLNSKGVLRWLGNVTSAVAKARAKDSEFLLGLDAREGMRALLLAEVEEGLSPIVALVFDGEFGLLQKIVGSHEQHGPVLERAFDEIQVPDNIIEARRNPTLANIDLLARFFIMEKKTEQERILGTPAVETAAGPKPLRHHISSLIHFPKRREEEAKDVRELFNLGNMELLSRPEVSPPIFSPARVPTELPAYAIRYTWLHKLAEMLT